MFGRSKRRVWVLLGIGLTSVAAAVFAYASLMSPTQVALVNLRDFQVADFLDAAENRWCNVESLKIDELTGTRLTRFDAIVVFAHGLTIRANQRETLAAAARSGVAVVSFGENMSENELDYMESDVRATVEAYIENWSPSNIGALLDFLRRNVDGKLLFAKAAPAPVEHPQDALFHPSTDELFGTVDDYEAHYRQIGEQRLDAPRVALLSMTPRTRSSARSVLDAIVDEFESRGLKVYPIAGHKKRLELLRDAAPDLVVTLPHGRLVPGRGEQGVDLLRELDVPVLAPITVNEEFDQWMADQRGMTGGMMSQSVIMPEVDGAIDALTLGALFEDERGLLVQRPLKGRIERLGERVSRWLELRRTANSEKRVAIVYYKAAGQNAMIASGLDVGASLFALLLELQRQGYDVGTVPSSADELLRRIEREGPLVANYAEGRLERLLTEGDPARIPVGVYESWRRENLPDALIESADEFYGPPAPGGYMTVGSGEGAEIVVPRLRFGNVTLIPQPLPAPREDENRAIHGVRQPPSHAYIATYLWLRLGFQADALLHFGTHGSLEFTPRKQVALSPLDWPDALVGPLPHLYVYSVADIGEAIIAKRRGYGSLISHLTPPFSEADLDDKFSKLHDRIAAVTSDLNPELRKRYLREVTDEVVRLELHRDLGLDDLEERVLSLEEVDTVHDYIHELDHARITLGLHTLGERHTDQEIADSTRVMLVERLADVLKRRAQAEDRKRTPSAGGASERGSSHAHRHDRGSDQGAHAATPRARAVRVIDAVLSGQRRPESYVDQSVRAGLTEVEGPEQARRGETESLDRELLETLKAVETVRADLRTSPQRELRAVVRALSGRFTLPSSGGDPIGNPESIPTGRNMFGVRTERTPTEVAWQAGRKLADQLLAERVAELGRFPKKVAFTLWAGEFVRSEGTNLAQILHLLGVEPVRNSRGNVFDVRLVPGEELGRPRVDVVVQTSGQFRDLAASRITLIDRAVRLAAAADDRTDAPNYVREGSRDAEAVMKERGVAPAEARRLSTARIFGGVDGEYGTGVMGMVEKGDSWEEESEIAAHYLDNMGMLYSETEWAAAVPGAFEGALSDADTVVLGRTSNTWGPVSLDHVYEYVGGISAAIREVNGDNPAAYFADMRNRYDPRVQGVREAIWSESRTTLLNDKYVTSLMQDGASAAEVVAESFRNVFGWNATRPEDLDAELWGRLYDVYVEDGLDVGVREFFEAENPYALQEMSAVLLESHRKNYWQPADSVVQKLSELHAELVAEHGAGCSGFVCDNRALSQNIAERLDGALGDAYEASLADVLEGGDAGAARGMTLERESLTPSTVTTLLKERFRTLIVLAVLAALITALLWFGARGRRRRPQ